MPQRSRKRALCEYKQTLIEKEEKEEKMNEILTVEGVAELLHGGGKLVAVFSVEFQSRSTNFVA